ncbi:RnfABCDGE type electron transport complex subunit D [Fulvivirga sedimenti]|uniref:RnfABCDGE type electron transport complex subunit D n=1 Tax=Fulvivirga sedimenti TaxID=2879465 RepID=A0A9X1L086_9BACT|nr:RnfABCDGE type electron transport complex subunit D [Fulvivirga sedimenti]MCA6075571.1 RnfABCDGE type electron transport complex subunit D [Fulvivirga sedimenti]MCA6076748.1 RnfABCDGE type electron transport complex subunit D [Fulvivirga sedimenti]MCA6077876.1 RnfABCDGE type electron transport complex subunit D [Fulvivirga sedimenti]
MKFPSLFRTPRHQRFTMSPRYYDPVKEEMDARVSQIKSELKQGGEAEQEREMGIHFQSRITGSFTRRSSRNSTINLMQMAILALLVGTIAGYWYFGNVALYVMFGLSSVLLYLKLKRII